MGAYVGFCSCGASEGLICLVHMPVLGDCLFYGGMLAVARVLCYFEDPIFELIAVSAVLPASSTLSS